MPDTKECRASFARKRKKKKKPGLNTHPRYCAKPERPLRASSRGSGREAVCLACTHTGKPRGVSGYARMQHLRAHPRKAVKDRREKGEGHLIFFSLASGRGNPSEEPVRAAQGREESAGRVSTSLDRTPPEERTRARVTPLVRELQNPGAEEGHTHAPLQKIYKGSGRFHPSCLLSSLPPLFHRASPPRSPVDTPL